MKAKQLKNGSWTISGISSEEIVALADFLAFARCAEQACGNHPVEEKEAVLRLREQDGTLEHSYTFEFFFRCLKQDIQGK